MKYKEAVNLMFSAKVAEKGKPLCNNTRLFQRETETGESFYVVRLHSTDIVEIYRDDTYVLNAGAWQTVTTKSRINEFSPAFVYQEKGIWYLATGKGGNRWGERVPFFDGVRVDDSGFPLNAGGVSAKKLEAAKKKLDRLCSNYVRGFRAHCLEIGSLPVPNNGDCWLCALRDSEGKTWGDHGKEPYGDVSHILEHLRESYFHGSILWNAVQRRGNPSVCWSMSQADIEKGRKDVMIFDDLAYYLRVRKTEMLKLMV